LYSIYFMDLEPENEFISFSKLESYIEKYPEDAEKWLEFIKIPEIKHDYRRNEVDQDILETQRNVIQKETNSPIDNFNDGCLYCKKSWESTESVPTTTLICGHRFHTLCYMYEHYSNDTPLCIIEGCNIDTWAYVREIYRSKKEKKKRVENILLTTYRKRADFKLDLLELKKYISHFNASYRRMYGLVLNGRRDLLHKHLHSLHHLQEDMNDSVNTIQSSEESMHYKLSIKKYRKHAAYIFRKYHVSFRDLYNAGLIKSSWQTRFILERHRKFSFSKLNIRLYPGGKKIKEPLATGTAESDLESESED